MREIELTFTIGVSGSGKTSYAKEVLQREEPGVVRIIERDVIRKKVFAEKMDNAPFRWSEWNWKWEKDVDEIREIDIVDSIRDPRTMEIIFSDINLNKEKKESFINRIRASYPDIHFYVTHIYLDVKYEDAVKNDFSRDVSVGPFVIAEQKQRMDLLLGKDVVQDTTLPKAIIVDLDGTLAINPSGKRQFDPTRYLEDEPNELLVDIITQLATGKGYRILFVSGREGTLAGIDNTWAWLRKHVPMGESGDEHTLFMRPEKDHTPDESVKSRIFYDKILPYYYVVGVFDDRPKVCRMWRTLGLKTYQLGNPHIEF